MTYQQWHAQRTNEGIARSKARKAGLCCTGCGQPVSLDTVRTAWGIHCHGCYSAAEIEYAKSIDDGTEYLEKF